MSTIKLIGSCDAEQAAKFGGKVCDGYVELPVEYLTKLANNPAYIIIVSEMGRPGAQLFFTKLEYTVFPPAISALNSLFQLGFCTWDACFDMPYMFAVIPADSLCYAADVGVDCGIVLVNGAPTLIAANASEDKRFPVVGNNIYRIVNQAGSPVYLNAMSTQGPKAYQERIDQLLTDEQLKIIEFLTSEEVSDNKQPSE